MFARFAALGVVVMGLTSAGAGWSQESSDFAAGDAVITVAPVDLKIGKKVLARVEADVVVQVEQVSAGWLLVTSQGKNGWIPQSSVAMVDKATVDRLLAQRASVWDQYQGLPANVAPTRAIPPLERLVRVQRGIVLLCEHLFDANDENLKQETEIIQALLTRLEELYTTAGRTADAESVAREIRSIERKLAADIVPGATARPGQVNIGRGDVVIAHDGVQVKAGTRVLVQVPAGELLRVDATKPDWLQVTYQGKTGWIRAGEVSLPVASDLDRLSREREADLQRCGDALKGNRLQQARTAIDHAVYLQRVVLATVLREFPANREYASKAREELYYSLQIQLVVLERLGLEREAIDVRREMATLEPLIPPREEPSSGTRRPVAPGWRA